MCSNPQRVIRNNKIKWMWACAHISWAWLINQHGIKNGIASHTNPCFSLRSLKVCACVKFPITLVKSHDQIRAELKCLNDDRN